MISSPLLGPPQKVASIQCTERKFTGHHRTVFESEEVKALVKHLGFQINFLRNKTLSAGQKVCLLIKNVVQV